MALPFLPGEQIREAFNDLKLKLTTDSDKRLHDLTDYFSRVWICSTVWLPHNWSVFKETVRTNNDVEGSFISLLQCFKKLHHNT